MQQLSVGGLLWFAEQILLFASVNRKKHCFFEALSLLPIVQHSMKNTRKESSFEEEESPSDVKEALRGCRNNRKHGDFPMAMQNTREIERYGLRNHTL